MADQFCIVIGGGIAGASAAFFLAQARGSGHGITLLEQESQPGYHTSGRSAAMYTEVYGNAVIRALVRSSKPFLDQPPAGFADHPLLSPRGALMLASRDAGTAALDAFEAEMQRPDMLERVDVDRCIALVPALNPDCFAGGILESVARDVDAEALLQGYLRLFRRLGGTVQTDSRVQAIAMTGGALELTVSGQDRPVSAEVVINAAGAWADQIGALAGAQPIGLEPMRRTALTFDDPKGRDVSGWPMAFDLSGEWYFKPDAGRILASPHDEVLSPPCDARPEELDIAICIDRIQNVTDFTIRRPASEWAGLRSFVPDHTPVNGFDDGVPGFYWLAGQGGYGIKTSPAMGQIAAAVIQGQPIPQAIADQGIGATDLAVERLR